MPFNLELVQRLAEVDCIPQEPTQQASCAALHKLQDDRIIPSAVELAAKEIPKTLLDV